MGHMHDEFETGRNLPSSTESEDSGTRKEKEATERRITPRTDLEIDLTVYGRTAHETPFYEQATAVRGNANGGLILLGVPVTEGQDLLLINNRTSRMQICSIVQVQIRDIQVNEVSVSFPLPNADFWKTSES